MNTIKPNMNNGTKKITQSCGVARNIKDYQEIYHVS